MKTYYFQPQIPLAFYLSIHLYYLLNFNTIPCYKLVLTIVLLYNTTVILLFIILRYIIITYFYVFNISHSFLRRYMGKFIGWKNNGM